MKTFASSFIIYETFKFILWYFTLEIILVHFLCHNPCLKDFCIKEFSSNAILNENLLFRTEEGRDIYVWDKLKSFEKEYSWIALRAFTFLNRFGNARKIENRLMERLEKNVLMIQTNETLKEWKSFQLGLPREKFLSSNFLINFLIWTRNLYGLGLNKWSL